MFFFSSVTYNTCDKDVFWYFSWKLSNIFQMPFSIHFFLIRDLAHFVCIRFNQKFQLQDAVEYKIEIRSVSHSSKVNKTFRIHGQCSCLPLLCSYSRCYSFLMSFRLTIKSSSCYSWVLFIYFTDFTDDCSLSMCHVCPFFIY